jgi:hypothetical protein
VYTLSITPSKKRKILFGVVSTIVTPDVVGVLTVVTVEVVVLSSPGVVVASGVVVVWPPAVVVPTNHI